MQRISKVLVVDGDVDVRSVVEDLLTDHGFEVRHAGSPEQAVLEMQREVFDILLCHLEMLEAGGGRLSQELQAREPKPRVVAMSASGYQAVSDEVDANLAKPFTRLELLATLRPVSGDAR